MMFIKNTDNYENMDIRHSKCINGSDILIKKVRHCLFTGGVFLTVMFSFSAQADVYIDSPETIKDNTDALVEVLGRSVVPGGIRSVEINGNLLKVKRFANPAGDNSEFFEVWNRATERKAKASNEILSVLNEYDPIYEAFTKGIPKKELKNNVNRLLNIGDAFADKQSLLLKKKVVDAIETPFTYETQQHRVIASVPIKSIDPDSSFINEESENGYLFMAEKSPGTTVSDAFWQMEFGEGFRFSDLFGKNGEDVNGDEPSVSRYPGSVMTMTYSENANDWHSKSWSYRSNGGVLSHITHYIDAFSAAGYAKESHSVIEADYGLVQFSKNNAEATLFVEVVDPQDQSVQVTLQMRSN